MPTLTLTLPRVVVFVAALSAGVLAADDRIDSKIGDHEERPHAGAVSLQQYRDDHAEVMTELREIRRILEQRSTP